MNLQRIYKIYIIILILFARIIFAQQIVNLPENEYPDTTHKSIKWEILAPVSLGIVGTNIYLYSYYQKAWWNEKRTVFHTFNDWNNADMNIDKVGHVYGGLILSKAAFKLYEYSNVPLEYNLFLSTLTSLVFQLQVEYNDAFFEKWGWSWWDAGADLIGAVYPNLQRIYEPLNIVNLKWSYYPSQAYKNGWHEYWIKDYEGFTYWLTFDVNRILPNSMDKYWPDWLNLAFGYGVDKVKIGKNDWNSFGDGGAGDREYYIGLDYNLIKIFNPKSKWLYDILDFLNNFHLPAPALRLTPEVKFYLIFL